MEVIRDIEQGSEEWSRLRIASIGGSSISKAVAGGQGKMRTQLLYDFVGELLSGEKKNGYTNQFMEEGIKHEDSARKLYEFETGHTVEQVALILHDNPYFCVSPDGLINDDGMIEIKTVIPSVFVERKLTWCIPTDYRRQIQWSLFVAERQWCDFVNYCPYLKDTYPLITQRVLRDEKEISELQKGADLFISEMLKMYEAVK